MARIGDVENLEGFRRCRVAGRYWSRRDPEFSCRGNINDAVWRDFAIGRARRERYTFPAGESLRVNYTKGRIPAIANVYNAVADTGCCLAERHFAFASLHVTNLESLDLCFEVHIFQF